ncbi:DUF4333 domain-containing protein [Nocardioides zeae]|uniref:DUF4333 domain-containing protein n=1 Tax=Nocardioides imazamoxiresistens TaxID=3231893 RepID=A0ABU3PS64_9ACTN|nr:DUF4333 domain-containing protein [Nocardioides zeae]MDT9592074.1 DUF4333 domain-containing protein [Nocardioides zeae]
MNRLALALTAAGAALALTACSAGSVESDDVEDKISSELTQQTGTEPDEVDCPEDLDAEEGATMTCVLTAEDGSTIDVDVEVTEVDGNDVSFDIQVADAPN